MPARRRRGRGRGRARQLAPIILPNRPNQAQIEALYRYLDRIYFDPSVGGGYSTPSKLLHEVKRRGHYPNVGLQKIRTYLNKHAAYTLYKPAKTRFPTPPVHVSRMNEQFDMDLIDFSRQQADNDGVRYFLSAIDVLSKYAFLEPLKTKEGVEVAAAARKIFDERQPEQIATDRGSEFKSKVFQQLCTELGIRHFFAGGSGKATVVERFHRTIRARIARYQYRQNTGRYIDALPAILEGYNKTWHRSIQMRPVDVDENNQHLAYENLYGKRKTPKKIPFQFKIGDSVRITGEKHPFRREFFQRWSEEVFTVTKRWRQRMVNMYRIKDCSGEELVGSFYPAELAKVTTSPNDLYRVERILDEKLENGQRYVKVQWQGYPVRCATWGLKSTVCHVC